MEYFLSDGKYDRVKTSFYGLLISYHLHRDLQKLIIETKMKLEYVYTSTICNVNELQDHCGNLIEYCDSNISKCEKELTRIDDTKIDESYDMVEIYTAVRKFMRINLTPKNVIHELAEMSVENDVLDNKKCKIIDQYLAVYEFCNNVDLDVERALKYC